MATEVVANGAIDVQSVQLRQRILPPPGKGEALVAVTASGVPPLDLRTSPILSRYETQSSHVPGCDLVGTVHSVGPNVNPVLVGRQVAALTETGGWANYALVSAAALVPALDMLEPAAVESLLVDGVAARQIMHRYTHIPPSTSILIHVGTGDGVARVLTQLASREDIRVVLAASSDRLDSLSQFETETVDVDADNFLAKVRSLAPNGLHGAFVHKNDTGTLPSIGDLLVPEGRFVSYTTSARQRRRVNALSSVLRPGVKDHKRPSTTFYNIWTGYRSDNGPFRENLREDITYMLDLLAKNTITASVRARLPLHRVVEAIKLAQSPAVGRVVLTPGLKLGIRDLTS